MNFWSIIAVVVVILKLIGVITLGWLQVIGITCVLLLAPFIIAMVIWLVTIGLFGIFAGILMGGAWCLDKIFGKRRVRLVKRNAFISENKRTVGSVYRENRRKNR